MVAASIALRDQIATHMEEALKECQNLNIDKVLLVCDKDNIGSAKSIKNNGAILENEIVKDGKTVQRYWIEIK